VDEHSRGAGAGRVPMLLAVAAKFCLIGSLCG
jgi:hypothetical protein